MELALAVLIVGRVSFLGPSCGKGSALRLGFALRGGRPSATYRMVEGDAASALFGEIETGKGSCSRFSASLLVPATSLPSCSKTRSTGEPRIVPSLSPLRREGQDLNKDFGWCKSNRSRCIEMSLIGQTGSTGSYMA